MVGAGSHSAGRTPARKPPGGDRLALDAIVIGESGAEDIAHKVFAGLEPRCQAESVLGHEVSSHYLRGPIGSAVNGRYRPALVRLRRSCGLNGDGAFEGSDCQDPVLATITLRLRPHQSVRLVLPDGSPALAREFEAELTTSCSPGAGEVVAVPAHKHVLCDNPARNPSVLDVQEAVDDFASHIAHMAWELSKASWDRNATWLDLWWAKLAVGLGGGALIVAGVSMAADVWSVWLEPAVPGPLEAPQLAIRQSTDRRGTGNGFSVANTEPARSPDNPVLSSEALWWQTSLTADGSNIFIVAVDGNGDAWVMPGRPGDPPVLQSTKGRGEVPWSNTWNNMPVGAMTLFALALDPDEPVDGLDTAIAALGRPGDLPAGVHARWDGRSVEFNAEIGRGPGFSSEEPAFDDWADRLQRLLTQRFGSRWSVSGESFSVYESYASFEQRKLDGSSGTPFPVIAPGEDPGKATWGAP